MFNDNSQIYIRSSTCALLFEIAECVYGCVLTFEMVSNVGIWVKHGKGILNAGFGVRLLWLCDVSIIIFLSVKIDWDVQI